MGIYTFTFQKLRDKISDAITNNEKIQIGFIQRHKDNNYEMLAKASELCSDYIVINANHLFFNYNNNDAILCIEDYGKIDVSEQCINLLTAVKDEFQDDFIDDETSLWKLLVFDKNAVYELNITSLEILTNEEEAIIKCRGCKYKYQ